MLGRQGRTSEKPGLVQKPGGGAGGAASLPRARAAPGRPRLAAGSDCATTAAQPLPAGGRVGPESWALLGPAPRQAGGCPAGSCHPERPGSLDAQQGHAGGREGDPQLGPSCPASPPQTLTEPGRTKSPPRTPTSNFPCGSRGGQALSGAAAVARSPTGRPRPAHRRQPLPYGAVRGGSSAATHRQPLPGEASAAAGRGRREEEEEPGQLQNGSAGW